VSGTKIGRSTPVLERKQHPDCAERRTDAAATG
jgi:hypothetical protein